MKQVSELEPAALHQPVKEQPADEVETADHERAEDELARHTRDAEDFMQVAVAIIDDRVEIPTLSRPEPNPAGAAYERADDDQRDPHEEAPQNHRNRERALPPS